MWRFCVDFVNFGLFAQKCAIFAHFSRSLLCTKIYGFTCGFIIFCTKTQKFLLFNGREVIFSKVNKRGIKFFLRIGGENDRKRVETEVCD